MTESPGLLYHYTSAPALLSIVQTRKLWVTDSAFLNDGLEAKIVPDLLLAMTKSQHAGISERKRAIIKDSLAYGKVFLLASFSRRPNMLTQYRMYCPPKGGFCIGFPREALAKSGHLIDVLYRPEEHEARCREYFAKFAAAIDDIDDGVMSTSEVAWRTLYAGSLLDERCELTIQCKSSEFSVEEEVRLLKWGTAPTRLRSSSAGHLLIPYADVELPNEEIELSISVGPNASRQLAMQGLSWLQRACDQAGTKWKVGVSNSGEFGFREL